MKKKSIFAWLAALVVIAGVCLCTQMSASPQYMTFPDDNCYGYDIICAVIEG